MNIHTTRLQRITITAPWEEMSAAEAFCRHHGYTITYRSPKENNEFALYAEREVIDYGTHQVDARDWRGVSPERTP